CQGGIPSHYSVGLGIEASRSIGWPIRSHRPQHYQLSVRGLRSAAIKNARIAYFDVSVSNHCLVSFRMVLPTPMIFVLALSSEVDQYGSSLEIR
ncbi:MAG: hypothetical protein OXI81_10125, partial [Paracoccaceae bacterium]|nr:hypothetical protein [Paracoccaceae bacterium]